MDSDACAHRRGGQLGRAELMLRSERLPAGRTPRLGCLQWLGFEFAAEAVWGYLERVAGSTMIVRWSDVSFTIEPGIYTCRGARLKIDRAHIAAWKADPETAFSGRPQERSRELVYVLTRGTGESSPDSERHAGR